MKNSNNEKLYNVTWSQIFKNSNMVLCNELGSKLLEYDDEFLSAVLEMLTYYTDAEGNEYELLEDIPDGVEYEEHESYDQIYQWYVLDNLTVEFLERNCPDIPVIYSPEFDVHMLPVMHWGTSWNYVFDECRIDLNETEK